MPKAKIKKKQKSGIERKFERLEWNVQRYYEKGYSCDLSDAMVADQIEWFMRFYPEYREKCRELADKMIAHFYACIDGMEV